jgi:hypothetical protein
MEWARKLGRGSFSCGARAEKFGAREKKFGAREKKSGAKRRRWVHSALFFPLHVPASG